MTGSKVGKHIYRRTIQICLIVFATAFCTASPADQTHPDLDGLFDQLKQAESNAAAQVVEGQIWTAWLDAPDANAGALMSQLSYAMSVGQLQLARRLSDQLIDTNPTFAEAWNKRATINYLLDEHGRSVADIKETLILEPRHFGALSGLGLIFMASGNYEAAVDAFNAVLEISPSSNNARGSVAQAQSLIGEGI